MDSSAAAAHPNNPPTHLHAEPVETLTQQQLPSLEQQQPQRSEAMGMPFRTAESRPFWAQSDEKEVNRADVSHLNKILNDKLNMLGEGKVEIRKLQSDPTSPLHSCQTFEDLKLRPELIRSLYLLGFHQPSKIQEAALQVLLADPPQDIIAQSQSGTGKTAAFLLAMLQRLDPAKKHPQCLVVAPTFELARQIGEAAARMAQNLTGVKVRYATKSERVPYGTVFTEQILVGTPGKTLDWMTRFQYFDPSRIISFAIDEADVMIDEEASYKDKSIRIHNIIVSVNPDCQCALFSATYNDRVLQFAERLIADPMIITIRRQDQSLPYIRQFYVRCSDRHAKFDTIMSLYQSLTVASSIIFCHTRACATWLAGRLGSNSRDVALLHGQLDVVDRERIAREFKEGKYKILITTNVISRGVDMPQVSLVVNYDPPVVYDASSGVGDEPRPDFDTYLHRIGRTGRFGKPGIAVNLVDGEVAMKLVSAFERHFGRPITELDAKDNDQLDEIETNSKLCL